MKISKSTGMITARTAGRLVDLTPQRLRQLARAGYIPRAVDGHYPLVAVVQGYIRFLQDDDRRSAQTRADADLKAAQRREIELRIATTEGGIIDRADVAAVFSNTMKIFREELASFEKAFDTDIAAEVDRIIGAAIARAEKQFKEALPRNGNADLDLDASG